MEPFIIEDNKLNRRSNCQIIATITLVLQTITLATLIIGGVLVYDKYQIITPILNHFMKLIDGINITNSLDGLKAIDPNRIKYLLDSVNNVETLLNGFKKCLSASHLCSL